MMDGTVLWLALALAAIVLVLAHARAHFRPTELEQLVQAPLSAVTPDLLAERRPILVEDRMVDPASLARSPLFRWLVVSRGTPQPRSPADGFATTRARFTLVFYVEDQPSDPSSGPVPNVVLKDSRGADVVVRLAPGRVLVLPPGWRYMPLSASPRALTVALDDAFSYFFTGGDARHP